MMDQVGIKIIEEVIILEEIIVEIVIVISISISIWIWVWRIHLREAQSKFCKLQVDAVVVCPKSNARTKVKF